MSRLIAVIAGLLLLWALFEFGARSTAPGIQQDIQTRTDAAIDAAGYADVVVSVDGRDVSLNGKVDDEDSVVNAGEVAAAVNGVRMVESDVSVSSPYVTIFCKDDTTILLSGDVPDDDARDAFPERARDMFRYWNIDDNLEVRTASSVGFRRFMDEALIELGDRKSVV